MKTILFILLSLCSVFAFSQEKSAIKVEYNFYNEIDPRSVKVSGVSEAEIPAAQQRHADQIKAMVLNYELIANKAESQFELKPKIDNNQDGTTWSFGDDGVILYHNLKDSISLRNTNYPDKYIIKDSLKSLDWTIVRERKKVCGFNTLKATLKTTIEEEDGYEFNVDIEAWFAPKISYPFGPKDYYGLPGIILELNIKTVTDQGWESKRNFVCTNIEQIESSIKKPTKGEIISPKEMKALWLKLEKEREEKEGGGVDVSD